MHRMSTRGAAFAASFLMAGVTLALPASTSTTGSSSSATTTFAAEAARGGMMEVDMGRLAAQKAVDPRVRAFGERMVRDHSTADAALRQAAAETGVDLPGKLDAQQRQTIDDLAALSGPAFDHAYMKDMVKDHEEDVAAFRKEVGSSVNSPIQAWAVRTLPTLEEHLRLAQETSTGLQQPPLASR
jgi:putative membrane protein